MMIRRSMILIIFLGFFPFAMILADKNGVEEEKKEEIIQKTKRPPIVVMKQSNIQGKVFFLTEKDESDAVADNLLIQLSSLDDNSIIHETATDTNGVYTLPNLGTGNYGLNIGRLKMELIVEDPASVTRETSSLPKNIIVFIPRAMDKKAERKKRKKR